MRIKVFRFRVRKTGSDTVEEIEKTVNHFLSNSANKVISIAVNTVLVHYEKTDETDLVYTIVYE